MDWTLHARWALASRQQAGRWGGLTRWDTWDLAMYEAHVQFIATGRRHKVSRAGNKKWLVREALPKVAA